MIKSIPIIAFFIFSFTTPVFGADLFRMPEAWKRLDVPRQPATQFEFVNLNELKVTADRSVAFLYCELNLADRKKQALHWRWRVEKNFPATNLSVKKNDDRPLAVHVWFDNPDAPSLFGTFRGIFGYPPIGHMITYVFGGTHPPGTILQNPYFDNGVIIALRGPQAKLNHWYKESRNIQADFQKSFPSAAKVASPRYIVVSADTDGTQTQSVAWISQLHLSVNFNPALLH